MALSIELDKEIYVPGERIQGVVRLEAKDRIKHKGVRIKVSGVERVYWQEGSGKNRRTYSQMVKHFEETITLFGPTKEERSRAEAQYIDPGSHTFPFSYPLPPNLPSSISPAERSLNYLTYSVKAYVDKPMAFDIDTVAVFFIHSHIPGASIETFLLEHRMTKSKTFNKYCCCCCCFQTPPIEMLVEVPRRLYAPGDTITARVHIENNSKIDLARVCMSLTGILHLKAGNRTHSVAARPNNLLETMHLIPSRTSDRELDLQGQVTVPQDIGFVMSTLDTNQCLNVQWNLRVIADPVGCGQALVIDVPLLIAFACCSNALQQNPGGANPANIDTSFFKSSITSAKAHHNAESLGMDREKSDWVD